MIASFGSACSSSENGRPGAATGSAEGANVGVLVKGRPSMLRMASAVSSLGRKVGLLVECEVSVNIDECVGLVVGRRVGFNTGGEVGLRVGVIVG